jgi:hypothetical protein
LANIENRRSSTGNQTVRYTKATPIIRGWLASMATGDETARADFFERLVSQKREDIIAQHPDIDPGQADTEARAAALSSLRSRNPFVAAIGRMPTEQEYGSMMAKLTPDAREKLTSYMTQYDRAIQTDSGGTATVHSYTSPAGGTVTTARVSTGGGGTRTTSGGGGRLAGLGGAGAVGAGGLPSISRLGAPRLARFNVASRMPSVPRTRLTRPRLSGMRLPKLGGRLKRPRLRRAGGRLVALKRPKLRRLTLA